MIVKIKKSDIEMFCAFINQCEGEIIANRPRASTARAWAELQPSQQSSKPTEEESVQATQEGNPPANGNKSCISLYPPIRFEYNLHTI